MTALSGPRMGTVERDSKDFSRDIAANVKIWQGAIVALSATGYATPGATATTLVADGIAVQTVDNTGGSAAAFKAPVRKGTFRFANSASTDAITRAEIGDDCWIVDDQTVAKTNGGDPATRSKAGRIMDVDAQGVWVEFR